MGSKINMHYVGGRTGDRSIQLPEKFSGDVVNIFYEADTDCIDHIKSNNKDVKSKCVAFPYCLSDSCKKVTFNINYDPFTSSFYKPNPLYGSHYAYMQNHDYIASEATETVETRELDAVSLDSIRGEIPPLDFLAIDTQGAEYEVLAGARESMESDTVAVIVEANFSPMNSSNVTLDNLIGLMAENGFQFAKLLRIYQASPYRQPIGLRGLGLDTAVDALFLRNLDTIKNNLMLWKLAFLSIIFNLFEYGMECLNRSKKPSNGAVYTKFLEELKECADGFPVVYPHTFKELFPTFEKSKERFNGDGLFNLKVKPSPVDSEIRSQGWSRVEMALIKYGMENQAGVINKRRHIMARRLPS